MQELNVIETPENVELEQPLAGIGSRFLAGLVDNLIIFGVSLILILLISILWMASPFRLVGDLGWAHVWVTAFLILLLFAFYWGYFVFFEMRTNGQSPGKKAVRLRVVKEGGAPITFTDVAIRNLLRVVDAIPLYGIAGVCMFLTRKVQRLGDLAAGTVVVSEDVPDYSSHTDRRRAMQWEQEINPAALRATGLTPREYRLLFNYWMRREELSWEARQRVLPQLLRPVFERSGRILPADSVQMLEDFLDHLFLDMPAEGQEPPAGGPA